jgi:hypothetical protein
MIDVRRIRSLKSLEKIEATILGFLEFDRRAMVDYYEDINWGEEDYESDRSELTSLLEDVRRRHTSLSGHLAKQATNDTSPPSDPSDE